MMAHALRNGVCLSLLAAVLAGCVAPGGSGNITGVSSNATPLEVLSARVVDGSLRDVTVHNRAAAPIAAGTWKLALDGTTNGQPSHADLAAQGPALAANATGSISLAGTQQPDWQDGTNLTIRATAPGGSWGTLTIRTV